MSAGRRRAWLGPALALLVLSPTLALLLDDGERGRPARSTRDDPAAVATRAAPSPPGSAPAQASSQAPPSPEAPGTTPTTPETTWGPFEDEAHFEERRPPGQPAPYRDDTPMVVAGRVVDERGEPLSGVTLELFGGSPRSPTRAGGATSGPDGRFRFEPLERRSVLLVARAPGRIVENRYVHPGGEDPGGEDPGDVWLRLSPGGLTAEGRVVDATGAPVPDAALELFVASDFVRATTGPDGRFAVGGLPAGSAGPGHASVWIHATAGAGEVRRDVVVGPGHAPVELVLARAVRLRLRVDPPSDADGSTPHLRGQLFGADGRELNPFGGYEEVYELECHEGDWADVTVSGSGLAPRRVAVRAPGDHLVRLAPGGGVVEGRLAGPDALLRPGPGVEVTWGARPDELPEPPTGAAPEERPLLQVVSVTYASADGAFRLTGLPPAGEVRLRVRRPMDGPRYLPAHPDVLVIGGPPQTVHVGSGAQLRLRPVAAGSGTPLSGRVRLRSPGVAREVEGGSPTTLELVGLPAGRHELLVDAPGWRARRLEVDLGPDEVRDLGDVAIERGATLQLGVRWPAVALASVELVWTDADGPHRQLFAPGRPVYLETLPPGPVEGTLTAVGVDGSRRSAPFMAALVAAETTSVLVDLRQPDGR